MVLPANPAMRRSAQAQGPGRREPYRSHAFAEAEKGACGMPPLGAELHALAAALMTAQPVKWGV